MISDDPLITSDDPFVTSKDPFVTRENPLGPIDLPIKTTRTAAYVAVARNVSDERLETNAAMTKPKMRTEMETAMRLLARLGE